LPAKKKKAKKKAPVKKRTSTKKLETDRDIAYDFAMKSYRKFKEVIKSIVLFGSVAKNEAQKGSDIDIIIIIDDCVIDWDQELIAWYRQELTELLSSQNYNKKLHLTTITLSTFMEEVRAGIPTVINMLRYGETLIDHGGFFNPLKVLLAKGKIRPTTESIFVTLRRSPMHLAKAKIDIVASIENIYWSMVDSSHAALMAADYVPPSPEHIAEMLDSVFVKRKVLNGRYSDWFKEMYELAHDVMHGNVKYIAGKQIDKYLARAEEFEKVMRNITSKIIKNEKIIRVEKKEN
jgi:predicted nucleotidyltransferase/uncharacterized protein (UPF0332 family)